MFHGAADGWPGWYVDRVGQFALSQGAHFLNDQQIQALRRLMDVLGLRGAWHKSLRRRVGKTAAVEASPQFVMGDQVEGRFPAMENGLSFELSFGEGYSVGLFLDQRDNRRRVLTRHISAGFPLFAQDTIPTVLNTFAYTCGFSVCAAKAGAHTTSVDLSRKYLDWGRHNFIANELDPAAHEFIHGDTFDWLRRFERKGRRFDLVLLDPPTFSQSKHSGKFQAQKDYGKLVSSALPVVKPGGVLFASTNDAEWAPEHFLQCLTRAIARAGRSVVKSHYVPQPPDFPMSKTEPGYLKTIWLRLD
jgi:23S rRNA (cytosine1962-C5)-methyltransferase